MGRVVRPLEVRTGFGLRDVSRGIVRNVGFALKWAGEVECQEGKSNHLAGYILGPEHI